MPILGERFYQMSNAIFCYDLKPIPLAVYSYLVCCAGQKDVCWPSMKTIALHCGCSYFNQISVRVIFPSLSCRS